MKRFLSFLLFVVLLCGSSSGLLAQPPQFFEALYDVPVMPGLVEIKEQQSIFDTPQGRIVQVGAFSQADQAEIMAFYAQTLPQMGWRVIKNKQSADEVQGVEYHREKENLRIFTEKSNGSQVVHFYLYPAAS